MVPRPLVFIAGLAAAESAFGAFEIVRLLNSGPFWRRAVRLKSVSGVLGLGSRPVKLGFWGAGRGSRSPGFCKSGSTGFRSRFHGSGSMGSGGSNLARDQPSS